MKKLHIVLAIMVIALSSFVAKPELIYDLGTENDYLSEDYTYYQDIESFAIVVNDAISTSEASASTTGSLHGFSIVKNSYGYGISVITDLSGTGVSPGDVNLCSECGTVTEGELDSMLNGDPCWFLVAESDGVWGWNNGC